MANIPISVKKIKTRNYANVEVVEYLVTVSEKGEYWTQASLCDRKELTRLRDQLNSVLNDSSTAEQLSISEELAAVIDKAHKSDPLCNGCSYLMSRDCVTCFSQLQSPLERQLFIALKKEYVPFQPQYGIGRKGQHISTAGRNYGDPINNFKDVLTIPDFFIEKRDIRICVYADGFTYHDRNEEDAQHDKNIDRQLQSFGYIVLRFTGKDIRENVARVVREIKAIMDPTRSFA